MAIANITGNILTDSGTNLSSLVSGSGTTNYIPNWTASGTLGNSAIYDNDTNIGIGTTTPLHKLAIASSSSAVDARSGVYIYSTDSMGANLGGQLFFGGSYTGTSETFWASIAGRKENATDNNVAGYLAFATRPAGGSNTERMRITSAGNVGIGTSSPTNFQPFGYGSNIEVSGGRGGGFVSSNSTSTVKMIMSVDGTSGIYGMLKTLTNHPLMFATNDTERMRITSAGNVGIGTSSLSSWDSTFGALEFPASSIMFDRTAPNVYLLNNAYYDGAWKYKTTNPATALVQNNSGEFQFRRAVSGTANAALTWIESMRITSGGNIRTYVTPSVDSKIEWYNTSSGTIAGEVWSDGNPRVNIRCNSAGGVYLSSGATSWTGASDETLKDINFIIDGAIDKINTLRAVNFSWKSDETKKENLGLIAQDVEKVFPQIVDEGEDGIKGVRYTELIPVLVKAIQEQQAQIDELKALIAAK